MSKHLLKSSFFLIIELNLKFFLKETQAFINHLQVLNQVDEIMKIQKKSSKIESIRQMHKMAKEKSNQV